MYLRYQDGPHESFIVLDQQITNEIKGQPAQLFQMGVPPLRVLGRRHRRDDGSACATPASPSSWAAATVPGADTTMYGEPAGGLVRSVFLQDPEGNYVQLDQRA